MKGKLEAHAVIATFQTLANTAANMATNTATTSRTASKMHGNEDVQGGKNLVSDGTRTRAGSAQWISSPPP